MNKIIKIIFLALLILLGSLAGCSSIPRIQSFPDQKIDHSELLSIIQDGMTTRGEVVQKLGPPSAEFEERRILTYLLRVDKEGEWDVVSTYPYGAYPDIYSLVLVFGPKGVLEKHSLVGSE